jgi:hypothetical protein
LFGLKIFLISAVCAQQSAPPAQAPAPPNQGSTRQDPKPPKPLKRVHVELKGFELDKASAMSSTQIGGGSRGIGGKTALLAPRIGRTYTANPTFRWSHSTQAQNFTFQIFDESGAPLSKVRVNGREYHYPETAPQLRPGATYRWNVQPEVELLGGSSETFRIMRVPENEMKEIAGALQTLGTETKAQQLQRAQIFTDHRLWFDAVDAYTNLIAGNPEDPELHERRGEIYDQLPSTNALAEEDFAVAEQLRSKATP